MRFAFRGVFAASLVLLPAAFGLSQPADENQVPTEPAVPSEGSEVAPGVSTESNVSEPAASPAPEVTEPAAPVAVPVPRPVAPAPSAAAPAPSLPSSTNEISLNLSGEVDLVTFLQGVAIATHTNFLYDEKYLAGKKVRLLTPTKIPEDKLFQLLESVLEYQQIVLVPSVGGIIKVVPATEATKKPMPLKLMEELEALPDSDQVVSAVYKLKYVTVPEVQPVIQPMLSQGAPIALLKSNILVITDSQSNLKRIARIVALVDDEKNVPKVKIIPIKHVSADYLAGQLGRVVGAQAATGAANKDQQQTKIEFDPASNSLIVVATAKGMAQVEELIEKLDVEPTQTASTRRRIALKNTDALEMASTLQQLAQGPPSGVRNIPGAPVGPGARYQPQPQAGAEGPGLITTGELKIIADKNTNSIIAFGPAAALNELETLIKDLDQRRAQVLIEALVVQVTGGKTLDIGTELGYFGGKSEDGGIVNSNFGLSTFDFTTGVRTIKDGTGVTYALVNNAQVPLLLRALLTESNGKVISRPRLLANDNQEAFFNSVDKQPTTTISTATGVPTTTSFNNYQEAGTKLKITPTISQGATGKPGETAAPGEGAYLTLKITLNISQFTGASTDPTVPPPQRSDDLETKFTMPDQSTVVIGGLSGYHVTNTTSGIPVLSKIPVLGALFRHSVQKRDDTTEYIFVKAQIARNVDFSDLLGLSNEAEQKSKQIEKQESGTVTNDNGSSGGK